VQITVFDQEGTTHTIVADKASSVMEMIRDYGLPISAQCGGCLSCATCHVYVDPSWIDRFPVADEFEEAMLELATELRPESRLSCQLKVDEKFDGLIITLAPGTEF